MKRALLLTTFALAGCEHNASLTTTGSTEHICTKYMMQEFRFRAATLPQSLAREYAQQTYNHCMTVGIGMQRGFRTPIEVRVVP